MITGVKISSVEMKRDKDATPTGMSINSNVDLDKTKVENGLVSVGFNYVLNYDEGVGTLRITGSVFLKEDNPEKFVAECKKTKKMPVATYKEVINAINFAGSLNGTYLVRISGFMPGIDIPMPPSMGESEVPKPSPAKKKAA